MADSKVTVTTLQKMRDAGERSTMLACYDASFTALVDECGIDMILVGDSLGMVVQGHDSTLPVTMEDAIYHTRCVARAARRSMVVGDLPFASYQVSPQQAYENAARLMAAGATMVKLEGGSVMAPTVAFIVARGIPVMGHLGLTPQSVHQLGGYRVQGKSTDAAKRLTEDAKLLAQAGAAGLVLECVPAGVGKDISDALSVPTLGIGGGPHCSGQILNLYDMLDIYPGKKARFVKNFMAGASSIQEAVGNFVKEVKAGTFPGPEHCF
jgi:3-methyl-2-oxobutanoate hydroxymethyltransferase